MLLDKSRGNRASALGLSHGRCPNCPIKAVFRFFAEFVTSSTGARLKTAEEEARKSQEERVNLETDLKNLRKSQNELLSKIKES